MSGSGGKGSVSALFPRLLRLGRRPRRFLGFDMGKFDTRVSEVSVEGDEWISVEGASVPLIFGVESIEVGRTVDDGGSGNIVNETMDPAEGAVSPEARDWLLLAWLDLDPACRPLNGDAPSDSALPS